MDVKPQMQLLFGDRLRSHSLKILIYSYAYIKLSLAMKIYMMSANKHKLEEMGAILAPLGFELMSHPDYSGINVEETGESFEENAALKAEALVVPDGAYALADDSGIAVDALYGAPGVYSARYAGENTSDEENYKKLLYEMRGVADRRAAFVCVLALAENGKTVAIFRGELWGAVADAAKGEGGFGYDPIFILEDGRSIAELSPVEKNSISHRRRALDKLVAWLKETSLN